jgi:truncated hemoglobin YjbI
MTEQAKYKHDLIAKIGGQSQFDFLIIDYCETIREDPFLQCFFGNFDLHSLITLQTEMLDTAFLDVSEVEAVGLRNHLALRHYRLFEMGFNEQHFDVLEEHFQEAMRDCWVEDDIMEALKKDYNELRPIFRKNGEIMLEALIQQQVAAGMLSLSLRENKELGELRALKESQDRLNLPKEHKHKFGLHLPRRKPRVTPIMQSRH